MQNKAVSKTAHRARLKFPARDSHTWNPTFRRNGRFIDAQCRQFAGTFEMFERMSSDGGIINFPTKVTAQIGCKLASMPKTGFTKMCSLFDNRATSHILIPPKHLIDLGVSCYIPRHNPHNSQILPRDDLFPTPVNSSPPGGGGGTEYIICTHFKYLNIYPTLTICFLSFKKSLHAMTSGTGLVEIGFSTNMAILGNVLDNKTSTFRPGCILPWNAGGAPIIAA
jgi:hypothetical protein